MANHSVNAQYHPFAVAFQGVPGAYSEEALRRHFGEDVQTLPCASFREMFLAVESGAARYGLQPVENSLAGTVAQSYELFMEFDVRIQAELILRVEHMLLAPANTTFEQVTQVRSHPQALAQCERYLARHGMKAVAWFDTAGSARDLAAAPEPHTAAIASSLAGSLYQLEVLDRGIEDDPNNFTRFFVIGRGDPEPAERNKTSIVFALQDKAGALYECLGEFATRGINMTKIESRPRRNKPWQYFFFVDLDGHYSEAPIETALVGLLRRAAILKILGSYPAAKQPDLT